MLDQVFPVILESSATKIISDKLAHKLATNYRDMDVKPSLINFLAHKARVIIVNSYYYTYYYTCAKLNITIVLVTYCCCKRRKNQQIEFFNEILERTRYERHETLKKLFI